MATLANFVSPFKPASSFYTGTGSTQLVPDVFPVAINGRPYLIDTATNAFTRQFDARVRDSVDQSAEPGESAINPQGLWRRSQSSWHYGAGQEYSDASDSEPFRFNTSKGVDVWEKGELTLLNDVIQKRASANTNLHMATADTRIYITDGQTVAYTTDLTSFTTVTGTNVSNLVDITSDGYNVFFSYADGNIDQTNPSTGAASNYITGITAGKMDYVKGRLMVAGAGSDKHRIWNIKHPPGGSAENNPTSDLLFTHPNTNFAWVGFAAGQNHIYCAGFAGNKSLIYKTVIQPDATDLTAPTVAGELPLGEVIQTVDGYLGFIAIGLADGFRIASSDSEGNLVIGPKIVTGNAVEAFAGVGQYIYFGYKNYDSTSTGIGRMDLSVFISPNQPAYASDLMVTGQGAVTDIHEFQNEPVFSVSGLGFYTKHTDLVTSGYLESGIYRWGVPDAKFIPKLDLRCLPLVGSITMSVASDGGEFASFPIFDRALAKEKTLDGLEEKVFQSEIKLTLARGTATTGPTVTRWMARAYAAPLRSQIFSVPIVMHHKLNVAGREYWQDVYFEMRQLRDLVDNPRVVSYQENEDTFAVVIEDVQWRALRDSSVHNRWDWEGTAIVVMRSVR
jgi:hypothetical protein